MSWWNHIPEHINPNIIEIGSFYVRWYGVMYLVAFAVTYLLVLYRVRTEKLTYPKETIQAYFMYAIAGILVGGRLGYVLFYDFEYFITQPLRIIWPFEYTDGLHYVGLFGMSYHGGFIGIIATALLFCRRYKIRPWSLGDLFAPAAPLGYTFGRIGNFVNGELYGRVTSMPWGMYFPSDSTHQLRHPSQLYEAFFEGIVLFVILWSIMKKQYFEGFHFCLYIVCYGTVRFFIEFVREPNPGLGSIFGLLTMGQLLCITMIVAGVAAMLIRRQMQRQPSQHFRRRVDQ